jgi:hypothetical protein
MDDLLGQNEIIAIDIDTKKFGKGGVRVNERIFGH